MILERIKNISEDFNMFDNDLDKYEYIVDLGKELKSIDEKLLKDEFLIQGCTSKVWLIPEFKEGLLKFNADSNSVIVRGLVNILVSIFDNLEPEVILSFDFEGLKELNLEEIISPSRQNGVYHMIEKIKHYAEIYRKEI